MGDTVSFDECVEERNADCDPKKLWMQIPWFCGNFRKVPTCFPKKYTKVIFTFYFQSVGSLATAGRWSRPSTTWSTSTSWWGSRRSWRHSFRCWRSRYQSEHDSQKNKINCFNSNPPPGFSAARVACSPSLSSSATSGGRSTKTPLQTRRCRYAGNQSTFFKDSNFK